MAVSPINVKNGVFEGWLEKKSKWLKRWRKRWIVCSKCTLASYTSKGKKRTESINLKKCTNVCKSGSLTFNIYKGNKIVFTFRAATYNEKEQWIKYISATIKHATNQQLLVQRYPPRPPRPFSSGSDAVDKEKIFIHTNLRINKNELLRARFAHESNGKHPELLIYGDEPEYDTDVLIRIDLICVDDEKTHKQQNKVRLQCKTWGELKNRDINQLEYPVLKTMTEITTFCIEYQKRNEEYSYEYNNCRKFMIELCNFLQIIWPKAYFFEEHWYGIKEFSKLKLFKKNKVNNNNNNNNNNSISISIPTADGDGTDTKDDYHNNFDRFRNLNRNEMLLELLNENVLCEYTGKYFTEARYKLIRHYTHCFIRAYGRGLNLKYKFRILLTGNNKYYSYLFNATYDQLKIIDKAILIINKQNKFILNRHINKRKKQKFDQLIKSKTKLNLLSPDKYINPAYEYSNYLQLLFCCKIADFDYLYYALKFPDKLRILLQSYEYEYDY